MRNLVAKPRKLENLAMCRLARWISKQARKLMVPISLEHERNATKAEASLSRQIGIIRNYIRTMPRMFHNQLAIEVIRELNKLLMEFQDSIKSQGNVIARMTEALFTENLTCLKIHLKGHYSSCSLYTKSYMLTGLVELDISYISDVKDIDIIQFLKPLHGLKYLSIKGTCSDNILICITKNCKLIEELSLTATSTKITIDNSIELLTKLQYLRSFAIYSTEVSKKAIGLLLKYCKNIEHINLDDHYHSNIILDALADIASMNNKTGRQFQLKSYRHRGPINPEQIQLLVQMCPQIQKLILLNNQKLNSPSPLAGLKDLKDLRELQLDHYDFVTDQVKEVLHERGRDLEGLNLRHVKQIDLNALIHISRTCPNLDSLTLFKCTFVHETFVNTYSCQTEIAPFSKLRTLNLEFRGWLQNSEEQLYLLLSNCPNVESIFTGDSVLLIEHIMFKVLNKNPLIHLQKWRTLWPCKVTRAVIDQIIEKRMSSEVHLQVPTPLRIGEIMAKNLII